VEGRLLPGVRRYMKKGDGGITAAATPHNPPTMRSTTKPMKIFFFHIQNTSDDPLRVCVFFSLN
jgi:hypothetical protein